MGKDPFIGSVLQSTYAITRQIGTGGMGTVYEAAHVRVDRKFAVKVLNCTLDHDEQVTARFKREAMIGSRLGHDHIVPVLDFAYTNDGHPFLVMELLEGKSLGEVMREADGPLPPGARLLGGAAGLPGAVRGPRRGRGAPGPQAGQHLPLPPPRRR